MTFQNYKLANNAKSTLAVGIMAGDLSMTCATGEGDRFPSTYPYFLTLEKTVNSIITKREIVKVTNKSGDTFTIARSAGYCPASATATTQTNTAFSFDIDDVISLRIIAENIDDINAELVRLGLVLYPDATASAKGLVKLTVAPTRTIGTATMTIASPCVVSKTAHGLVADDAIKFTTSGSLPTGIVAGTVYYVSATGLTADTFQLSATVGGASIVTTGSQVGTHTLYNVTGYAVGDNDSRMPTAGEKQALAGNYGTPGSGNKFVTETDPLYANNVKVTGDQTVAGIKTFSSIPVLPGSDPTTANQAVRKSYADSLIAETTGSYADTGGTITYQKRGNKFFYNFRIADRPLYVPFTGTISDATIQRLGTVLGLTPSNFSHACKSGASRSGTSSVSYMYWNGSTWTTTTGFVQEYLISVTFA